MITGVSQLRNKVVIVGAGNVGMSYAYALINQKTKVNDLVLIDTNNIKIEGESMDLNHGMPFSPSKVNVKAGSFQDCKDARIVCICAGASQKPGETRLDLLSKNDKIFKSIIEEVVSFGFDGIFLIATNPVDIMTYIAQKHSGFPKHKVIGSGTTLDTARLRYLISNELEINSKNIHAYILGEHGDSEFAAWSNAFVGSNSIYNYLSPEKLDEIALKVKTAAYDIIDRKGSTYYAIGMVLVRLTNAILDDENTIFTVSSYNEQYDIYIGMPSVVNASGVREVIDLKLNTKERESFTKSALIIKNEIKKI